MNKQCHCYTQKLLNKHVCVLFLYLDLHKKHIAQAHVHSVAGGGFLPFFIIILQFYLHNRHLVQFHVDYPDIYIKFMKIQNDTHMREERRKQSMLHRY